MINFISTLGRQTLEKITKLGRASLMLFKVLFHKPQFSNLKFLTKQIHVVGVQSLLIIALSGLFIGMVLGLQGYIVLVDFAAESNLGQLVALSLLRELGPVVTALLFAGRAGSALTAEIGLMKATEQLDSLEMMAVDPIKRIITPRFWAGVVSMPLLSAIFTSIGIMGSLMVAVYWKGIDGGSFWSVMQNAVLTTDLTYSLIKSVVFAVIITWIALFNGYDCVATSEGISIATTKTVVGTSIIILAADFILTTIMFGN